MKLFAMLLELRGARDHLVENDGRIDGVKLLHYDVSFYYTTKSSTK